MANMQNLGMEIAMGSIFILGIGVPIAASVITSANLSGIAATIVGFVPVILVAAYIFIVSKKSGLTN